MRINYLQYADRAQFDTAVALPRGSLLKAPLEELNTTVYEVDGIADRSYDKGDVKLLQELIARVESVLRRAGKTEEHYAIGDVDIDVKSMQVTKDGKPVPLTRKEYELLLLFVRNPNIALFRDTIYERVWEADFLGDSRTVDLHVQRIRKKLGWQNRLSAVYKVGYRLEVNP